MSSWSKIARRIRVPLGFVFAIFYFWLAHPTRLSLLVGLAGIVPGLLLRAAASGHVRKNEALATSGPYAYTRNPLYFGSLLIGIGFAIAARSWWIAAALLLLFFAIYLPVIRGEEEFLRQRFPEFEEYARHVPRIIPKLARRPASKTSDGFSLKLYLKHREWNALLGAAAIFAVLIVKLTI